MRKSTAIKSDVRNHVKEIIFNKIEKLEKFIEFTLDASRDIKKTPKYDSIREEMQEEIYQMQRQLAALRDLQKNMTRVLNKPTEIIQLGSMVFTNKARFYISVSLGEITIDEQKIICISSESPLAKAMINKKKGYQFSKFGL